MHLHGSRVRTARARAGMVVVAVAVAVGLAACSTSTPAATKKAAAYAQRANLGAQDLPSGWSPQGAATNSTGTSSTLTPPQHKSVHALLATLPSSCRVLDATFTASLVSGPPIGTVAQNQAQFSSANDGNSVISSTVVVFGSAKGAQTTFAYYGAPTFAPCLQAFLTATLKQIFTLSAVQVTVAPVPVATPPPAGVSATAFTVDQTGKHQGAQAQVSASKEEVVQSGSAMAFVQVAAGVTSLPPDAVTVFDQAASTVAHNLVPPPS